MQRKIWVRRRHASPTIVQVEEDSFVDEARDVILKKYTNSLGRDFDAPDITLRISLRVDQGNLQRYERTLDPEEKICLVIDKFYPGGQTAQDALLVDTPKKQASSQLTPHVYQYDGTEKGDNTRHADTVAGYFPLMPAMVNPAPWESNGQHAEGLGQLSHTLPGAVVSTDPLQKSVSLLNAGKLPSLPSPGDTKRLRDVGPKYQHQSTPSFASIARSSGSTAFAVVSPSGVPQSLDQPRAFVHRASMRPIASQSPQDDLTAGRRSSVVSSHLPKHLQTLELASEPANIFPPELSVAAASERGKSFNTPIQQQKSRSRHGKKDPETQTDRMSTAVPNGKLGGIVPAINVLLVDDNSINLRLLQGMMKRLGVRWQTATNGQIAVDKWRSGGFHLVLMDIQMPVMNGLVATKEIRRLETANGIGILSDLTVASSEKTAIANADSTKTAELTDGNRSGVQEDQLDLSKGSFKSPVIVVALTASSLQSDRYEALTAGCNDFVTKPVDFDWLERKLKEWGSMQALIDFDGWKKWKAQTS